MKRTIGIVCGVVLVGATVVWAATSVVVSVKQTSIRSERQFFAPTVATAKFQDKLAVSAKKGTGTR